MTAPFKTWTVLPHGPVQTVNDRIKTVVGDIHMPIGDFPRRMTVVRLNDGRLVIYSAISLNDEEMAALEAWGTPAFLVVPSERHRLDAPSWKARYPALQVIAPEGSRAKVAEAVPVDVSLAGFGDPSVRLVDVPGTDQRENALEVEAEDGLTLIVNEIIADVHGIGGVRGWLFKLMGFQDDEAQVPVGPKMQFKKGLEDLADQFRRWANRPDLKRIIVSHGDIIDADPAAVLLRLAESLEG
jgi:hypothetical protein